MRLFTIPPGVDFLAAFARALLEGAIVPAIGPAAAPDALARARIYVPSRRAATLLEEALIEAAGRPILLPRVVPLGDPAEIEDRLEAEAPAGDASLPPSIAPLDRLLNLMPLIDAWRRGVREADLAMAPDRPCRDIAASTRDAFDLAQALADLIDELIIEGAMERSALAGLAEEVPPEHDRFWQTTATFLEIAGEYWPQRLKELGLLDAAERRRRLTLAEVERLGARPAGETVIVAGSTGSQPSTAALMGAVARLPNGAVVLPGLDLDQLDDAAFEALHPDGDAAAAALTHPQAVLRRLFGRIGASRADVRPLAAPPPEVSRRNGLLAEAMRPAAATDRWSDVPTIGHEAAFAGVALIHAEDERDEALAVACAARQAIADGGGRVAIVTPDRDLAAHVTLELARFGLDIEDSAGVPLGLAPAGRLARLALDAAIADHAPMPLLALLRDPLAGMGLEPVLFRRGVDAIEIVLLRGRRPSKGLDGLIRDAGTLESLARRRHAPRPAARLADAGDAARTILARLAAAPIAGAGREAPGAFAARHEAQWRMLQGLAPEADAASAPGGAQIEEVFASMKAARGEADVDLHGYQAMFEALLAASVHAPPPRRGARIGLFGLLEARLDGAETVILAGLAEGVWPPQTRGDPFLTRSMRAHLGLTPPERRIGQSAHDFTMLFGAPRLVLSHAARKGRSPQIPSRFLQRLFVLLDPSVRAGMAERGRAHLDHGRALDATAPAPRATRPAPRPPARLWKRRLRLTDVETMVRNPYAIFARDILELDPLPPVEPESDAAERGTLLHALAEAMVKAHPADWPEDAAARFVAMAREKIAAAGVDAVTAAMWGGHAESLAVAFAEWERRRRSGDLHGFHLEADGALELRTPGGIIEIRGRIDRIDRHADGGFSVIDYKSGALPDALDATKGLSPQLQLSAALARRLGLPGLDARAPVRAMLYVKLGRKIEEKAVPAADNKVDRKATAPEPNAHVDDLTARLFAYLGDFATGRRAFIAGRRHTQMRFADPYGHLSRVSEWRAVAGDDAE
jgi:ATP-dependent helicase/nuclease subunit B